MFRLGHQRAQLSGQCYIGYSGQKRHSSMRSNQQNLFTAGIFQMRQRRCCLNGAILISLIIVQSLAGCSATNEPSGVTEAEGTGLKSVHLFSPQLVLQDRWQHMKFRGQTEYRLAFHAGRLSIRAKGKKSSSGLIRRVNIDAVRCPNLEWEWRVDAIQAGADLRRKDKEDVAASVFILFADPGFMSNPDPVPTLRYVWTNRKLPKETVVDNPYLPGIVRSIVVRSGTADLKTWVTERRNVSSDFQKAFGRPLNQSIHAVAIFTDNDQTSQQVEAHYGGGIMICRATTNEREPIFPKMN